MGTTIKFACLGNPASQHTFETGNNSIRMDGEQITIDKKRSPNGLTVRNAIPESHQHCADRHINSIVDAVRSEITADSNNEV